MSLGKAPEDRHLFSVGQIWGPMCVVTRDGQAGIREAEPGLSSVMSGAGAWDIGGWWRGLASAPLTVSPDTSAVATTNIME